MKKERSQKKRFVLSLFLLSLFIINIIVVGLVSADETQKTEIKTTITRVTSTVFNPIREMFGGWQSGDFSVVIAKYLFLILLALLIYEIAGKVPFLKGKIARVPASIIIAFLGTAYLTPKEIYLMLTSYGAMGLILGAIIPFLIIFFFSLELGKKGGVANKFIQQAVWLGFGIFLIYKLIQGWSNNYFGALEFWAYILILVGVVIMFLFQKKILKFIFKEELKEVLSEGKSDLAASLTAEINRREQRSQELSGGAKITFDRVTEKLKARLKEALK